MAFVQVLDVIADVAQVCRNAPNATLIGAYVRAARKFCGESRWYRSTVTGSTEAGTRTYSLGSDPYLEVLGLKAVSLTGANGKPKPLTVSDSATWDPNRGQGEPTLYAYVPEGQVALDRVPDAVYALTCTLVLQPKAGATQLPEELLVKWDQALQAGALGYLLELPGMPWTDKAEAQLKQRVLQAAINNAKADEQRGMQAGAAYIRRRPFIVGGRC